MKRTTVTLPDELATALEREARRRRLSISEVTRQALAEHLRIVAGEPRKLPFAALGRSGRRNTAQDAEEILADLWSRDRDR